jgi:hypothetical protein
MSDIVLSNVNINPNTEGQTMSRALAHDNNYADGWEPLPGVMPWGYFRGPDGKAYDYAHIARTIRELHTDTIGKHIFTQLDALGIRPAFDRGTTPCDLPFTFIERG